MKCFVCGNKKTHDKNKFPLLATYELPHGTISVCYKCRPALMFNINAGNIPIWWIAKEDLYCPDLHERISKEEADQLTVKDLECIAQHIEELLNEQYESTYSQVIHDALPYWKRDKEEELVRNTPKKELPLLIGKLKYKESKALLEERLKKGNNMDYTCPYCGYKDKESKFLQGLCPACTHDPDERTIEAEAQKELLFSMYEKGLGTI